MRVIFAEPQLSPKAAQVIADEIGGEVLLLDPLGGGELSRYVDLIRFNASALAKAFLAAEGEEGATMSRPSPLQTPPVEVEGLSVFLDGRKVLEEVSFTVEPGELMGIIGPNGAGKTSLLRVLLGLLKSYTGTVHVFGKAPGRLGSERHTIGYVPQRSSFDRRFPATVLDVVMMGRVACRGLGRRLSAEDRKAAEESPRGWGLPT